MDRLSVEQKVPVNTEPCFGEHQRWLELEQAVGALITNPRQYDIFLRYCDDTIHTRFGGEIYERHCHEEIAPALGTFVSQEGTIYRVRIDNGCMQLYTSPVDERGQAIECIQPYTYDGDIIDGDKVRVDFVNGTHHRPSQNTLEEMSFLRSIYRDPIAPIHRTGDSFHPDRDTLLFWQQNGQIEALYHDSESGRIERLFTMNEVFETLALRGDQQIALAA